MGIFDRFKPQEAPKDSTKQIRLQIAEHRYDWLHGTEDGDRSVIDDGGVKDFHKRIITDFYGDHKVLGISSHRPTMFPHRLSWNMNKLPLVGEDLRFNLFEHIDFRGSNLSTADIRGTWFRSCDFRNATFVKSNLSFAVFSHCDLRGTDFTDVESKYLDIWNCKYDPDTLPVPFQGNREIKEKQRFLELQRFAEELIMFHP